MAILVYDYETTAVNPEECFPVQLAAVTIDEITLKINDEDIFNTHIRPDNFDSIKEDDENTVWHSKHKKISPAQVLDLWRGSPPIDIVWHDFMMYVNKYNPRKTKFSAPIRAGHNIISFDDIITKRIHDKYGKGKPLFRVRDKFDLIDLCNFWFRTDPDIKSYSLDNLRDLFGMSKENAHDARRDILDTAEILVHFLKLGEKLYPKVIFKNALKNINV